MIRRVDGESVLLLGGGRALLMQLAHPMVAAAVAEHSGFHADPFARLQRTLEASFAIVFGTTEQARAAAASVRSVHEHVVGDGYRADDPALLMWVHATLVDTALRVHERFLRPLPAADAERYYDESTVVAELLGVPRAAQPPDLEAFRAYVRGCIATLEVSDTARRLARDVLHPRLPWPVAPVAELGRQITVGLLPAPLRDQYGLGWDGHRRRALLLAGLGSRLVLPRVPGLIRRVH
ncbi:MAG: DUF2236 domain-containing protein [Actinobacteria bacterium]|nr:MAG: DUF2236 domain-containing protein [Actinomycetota bacterium]